MKLEPVYLVAPEPAPKGITTRRAFLVAGTCFAAGAVSGFALQRSMGTPAPRVPVDPIVRWAREVSRDPARIQELREHYHGFLHAVASAPEDADLWFGFERLVDQLELMPRNPQTAVIAASLRQTLVAYPDRAADRPELVARLRAMEKR